MSQYCKNYSVRQTPDRHTIKELVWQRLTTALVEDQLDGATVCYLSQREELKSLQHKKEEQLFTRLYEQYRRPLIYYVMKKFAFPFEESEELVQDTFCKLWTNRDQFKLVQNAEQYLFTSTRNRVIDHKRSVVLKRTKFQEVASFCQQQLLKEDAVIYREYAGWFQKSIDNLPPRTRMVFCLNVLEGKTTKQIAAQIGCSHQTVKNQLNNATRRIKAFLSVYNVFDDR